MQDPLTKELTKTYRASAMAKVDKLLEVRSRWKRKQTIATNKLAEVEEQIVRQLKELAGEKDARPRVESPTPPE